MITHQMTGLLEGQSQIQAWSTTETPIHTVHRPPTLMVWPTGWVLASASPEQKHNDLITFEILVQLIRYWLYRVSTNLTEQISRRFQEGFQAKSRRCLHCFGLLCGVPNLLVCLNIEQIHDMHNIECGKDKKGRSVCWISDPVPCFIMTGNQCMSIIDISHKNFQEDHTNSRRFPGFPGGFLNSRRFPGVVDTLLYLVKLELKFMEI